jgi:hypothetical protein
LGSRSKQCRELFAKMQGAAELAQQYSVTNATPLVGIGGMITGLVTSALGRNAGILVSGMAQLQSLGLTVEQIKSIGQTVMKFATENGGRQLVNDVFDSIPGLKTQIAA